MDPQEGHHQEEHWDELGIVGVVLDGVEESVSGVRKKL